MLHIILLFCFIYMFMCCSEFITHSKLLKWSNEIKMSTVLVKVHISITMSLLFRSKAYPKRKNKSTVMSYERISTHTRNGLIRQLYLYLDLGSKHNWGCRMWATAIVGKLCHQIDIDKWPWLWIRHPFLTMCHIVLFGTGVLKRSHIWVCGEYVRIRQ